MCFSDLCGGKLDADGVNRLTDFFILLLTGLADAAAILTELTFIDATLAGKLTHVEYAEVRKQTVQIVFVRECQIGNLVA